MRDPVVEEVHRIRQKIFFEECGGDWQRFFERIKKGEAQHPGKMVRPEDLRRGKEPVQT